MATSPQPPGAASGNSDAAPPPRPTIAPPTREQKTVLWIAILASFVAFLDGTVVNVALPAMLRDLGGGISFQQWVVDAYLITLGALILVAGSVSDAYGRFRVLRWGLIGFGVASIAIGFAPTAGVLIAARLIQGAAGALLVPSSLALIMSTFRGAAQAKAIGTWTAATTVAFIAGPVVGGLLVDLASWRWVFFINVIPIAVVMWLMTRVEQRDDPRAGAHIDVLGAVMCAVGLGAPVYALIEGPNVGWGNPAIWVSALVGVVSFAGFVVRQARVKEPMMPLSLFRARNFAWGNGATLLIYGALSLNGFLLNIYLQGPPGLTATQAGLATIPTTIAMILLSSRVGALAGRLGPRGFMTVGPLIMAVGGALMLMVSVDFSYWTQVLPGVLLFGLGLSVTVAPLTSAILGAIETSRSGIASAVNNAAARIASLVAIGLVGTIVGGELDLAGFHRGIAATVIFLAAGGVVSWVGIRNPAPDAEA